ncbi:MAG: alanine racemase [Myxococcota bacterium]|nr:alanine racemase [Myxococcota bacterium]
MTNSSETTAPSESAENRPLVWCEVDDQALSENIAAFRALIGPDVILSVAVKSNAYGHGLVEASRAFLAGGADWLCVQTVNEAEVLRAAGIVAPIYVVGPIALHRLQRASDLGLRMVVYTMETVEALRALGCPMKLHLKIETGNYRQGISASDALRLAQRIAQSPGLVIEGVCSHFANIEDTTDHTYARRQLALFDDAVHQLKAAGHEIELRHLSNSAATILWPDQKFEMIRLGISAYGLWPSPETQLAAAVAAHRYVDLRPALTLKAQIVQVKAVPEGSAIGYGCTYVTTHDSKIAVLGIGYFDGYDRKLSNIAYGLCKGRRAPVRGRVCMNMMMVDVTHIPDVQLGDEVILLGTDGQGQISADQLAHWANTINYEIVSRIGAHLPRRRIRTERRSQSLDKVYRPPALDD